MTISSKGIELIKRFEGLRLKAYKCPAGVWTIGYGHTGGVTYGMTITEAEAEQYLIADVETFAKKVDALDLNVNQNQFDALVSFAYNLGIGNLLKSTLLKKIATNPNDPSIRKEFMKWVNANKVRLEGLVRRRTAEADLYFSEEL